MSLTGWGEPDSFRWCWSKVFFPLSACSSLIGILVRQILLDFESSGNHEKTTVLVYFDAGNPNLMEEVLKRTFYKSEL